MKKANIINLIKYYSDKDDVAFKKEAYQIADEFTRMGDIQLSEYIMTLLSNTSVFTTQYFEEEFEFIRKIEINNDPLPLPEDIQKDIIRIINASERKMGVNKFLFVGSPGTGKTESHVSHFKYKNKILFLSSRSKYEFFLSKW